MDFVGDVADLNRLAHVRTTISMCTTCKALHPRLSAAPDSFFGDLTSVSEVQRERNVADRPQAVASALARSRILFARSCGTS
jgi:hypothetical protein